MVFDNTKFLQVSKHGVQFYLTIDDVSKILEADRSVVSYQVTLLEQLNFCDYYNSILNIIKTYFNDCKSDLIKLELLYICDLSTESLLNLALREHIYFYKNKVLADLNNK